MKIIPIKTRVLLPPKDDFFSELEAKIKSLEEGDMVFVSSKLLAIQQGRSVKIKTGTRREKDQLIRKEADRYLPRNKVFKGKVIVTIKNNTMVSSAGIDKSNGNGYYILWPKNPSLLAKKLCLRLQKKFKIKKLAVVVVDSHSIPLRFGIVGISVGGYGLYPLLDLRGNPDIFGKPLMVSRTNYVDPLAAYVVLLMGESDEKTPAVIVRGYKKAIFKPEIIGPGFYPKIPKQDYFYHLYKDFRKGKSGK